MSILTKWSDSLHGFFSSAGGIVKSITNHNLLLGDAREKFIRDVLSNFLPNTVHVGTGIVIDSENNYSNQIDVIIYRHDFPIFRTLGDSDVYLIEGVIATIEVKSTLNAESMSDALENCESINKLNLSVKEESLNCFANNIFNSQFSDLELSQKMHILQQLQPLTFIYGYKGYKSKFNDFSNSIKKNFYNPAFLPEVIVSEGCVAVKNFENKFKLNDSEEWKGFVGKTHEKPIRYLLNGLLQSYTRSMGTSVHAGTSVMYGLEKYISLEDDDFKNWVDITNTKMIDRNV